MAFVFRIAAPYYPGPGKTPYGFGFGGWRLGCATRVGRRLAVRVLQMAVNQPGTGALAAPAACQRAVAGVPVHPNALPPLHQKGTPGLPQGLRALNVHVARCAAEIGF